MEHAGAFREERCKLVAQYNSLHNEYINVCGYSLSNPGQVMERRHLDKMLQKTHERICMIDAILKHKTQ
jgi:hypothetical protein